MARTCHFLTSKDIALPGYHQMIGESGQLVQGSPKVQVPICDLHPENPIVSIGHINQFCKKKYCNCLIHKRYASGGPKLKVVS